MKALSLSQPWATLVAVGAKQIETRSWNTAYLGPLAIHAAKAFPRGAIELCFEQPFGRVLHAAGINTPAELPRGAVIATARMVGCVSTGGYLAYAAVVTDQEDAFGDFSLGRYAWILADVERLPEPIPARGSLGLWEWQSVA